MIDHDIKTAERIAVLELQVKQLSTDVQSMEGKLDELLLLRSKGMGAFWLASSLFGTGIVGVMYYVIQWMRG